jgi:ABC-2 type transport system permease protein
MRQLCKDGSYLIDLYRRHFLVNVRAEMEYRVPFILGLLSIALMQVVNVAFIGVLLSRFQAIRGWSFGEVMLLVSLRLLSHAPHVLFGIQSRFGLNRLITDGTLDRLLVRPVDPLFQFFVESTKLTGVSDLVTGIAAFVIASHMVRLVLSFGRIVLLLSVIVGGALIETSVYLMVAVMAFWTMEARELTWMVYDIHELFTQYPMDIFGGFMQFVLTFIIPFGFVSYYPALLLLNKPGSGILDPRLGVFTLPIGCAVWHLAVRMWNLCLSHYQGSGS